MRVTGAGTTLGCGDPTGSVSGDVTDGAVLLAAPTPVDAVGETLGSGAVAGSATAAPSSAVALAMPIDATMPNIVDTPIPAATIRAPTAGWRRRGRVDVRVVWGGVRVVDDCLEMV